jgi:hypothetical protein
VALKRECDSCGIQENHITSNMKTVELPPVPKTLNCDDRHRAEPRRLDLCPKCLERVHKAADPVPGPGSIAADFR